MEWSPLIASWIFIHSISKNFMNSTRIVNIFLQQGTRKTGYEVVLLTGVPPEHWTNGMLGFPPTEENQHEEEQIYR